MKRCALVVVVALVLACGTVAADTTGWSVGGGAIALVPFFAPDASGIGGGISVGLPGVPVYLGAWASSVGDVLAIAAGADYRFIDRRGTGAIGWYLGAGGALQAFTAGTFFTFFVGVRLPAGIAIRPFAGTGLEVFLEVAPEWYPVFFDNTGIHVTAMYFLARPWLGVRYRF